MMMPAVMNNSSTKMTKDVNESVITRSSYLLTTMIRATTRIMTLMIKTRLTMMTTLTYHRRIELIMLVGQCRNKTKRSQTMTIIKCLTVVKCLKKLSTQQSFKQPNKRILNKKINKECSSRRPSSIKTQEMTVIHRIGSLPKCLRKKIEKFLDQYSDLTPRVYTLSSLKQWVSRIPSLAFTSLILDIVSKTCQGSSWWSRVHSLRKLRTVSCRLLTGTSKSTWETFKKCKWLAKNTLEITTWPWALRWARPRIFTIR